jgi:anti-sigma B factor antagonist
LPLIASGQRKLVVELSQLDYISSAGLRIFLLAAKRMDESKGKMILCSLKDSVKQVFEIAAFSSFLNLAGSIEEAIKNFSD